MSDGYIVEMSNITKTFPGVRALDNVSFHLKAGQVMALLGENGAGKSTLMKILSGVYTRDSGSMKIFGKD
ncbi:MAG: ATP-binding cassette domain-containing protein, partial [Sphaerochaetaceae bacterium]